VAKRNRGSRSAHRPGGQAPARARRAPDAGTSGHGSAPTSSWDADIDSAIDLVVLEENTLALDEPTPASQAARPAKRVKVRADSLDARVAAEDVYVREDLRRIAVVSTILIASLVAAWVVFVLFDVLDLY
jgi:hypothetical protein